MGTHLALRNRVISLYVDVLQFEFGTVEYKYDSICVLDHLVNFQQPKAAFTSPFHKY